MALLRVLIIACMRVLPHAMSYVGLYRAYAYVTECSMP
jgi:hypothetical protein